jgi:heat shock protein HspQ
MGGSNAKFDIGQLVRHAMFGYRGVILDIDPVFQGEEDWYDNVAKSRPPKDCPWYHVLVHGETHMTYVAERNLEPDESGEPVEHPGIEGMFADFRQGRYILSRTVN